MKFIQKLSEERRQQNSHSVLNSGTDRRASSFRHSLRNYAAAMILPAKSTLEMGMHARPQCGRWADTAPSACVLTQLPREIKSLIKSCTTRATCDGLILVDFRCPSSVISTTSHIRGHQQRGQSIFHARFSVSSLSVRLGRLL